MGRIVAIDFGVKRIGLAMSDKERKMALPLTMVEGGKKAIDNIRKALPLKEIDLILIGNPLELSGKQGPMSQMVQAFAKQIEAAFSLPVILIDERLSSKGAEVQMRELSLNRKQKNERVDMVAAMLLLQTYLEKL